MIAEIILLEIDMLWDESIYMSSYESKGRRNSGRNTGKESNKVGKEKKREKWGGQERKSPDGGQGRYKRRLKNREAVQSG